MEPTAPPTGHWCRWGDHYGHWAKLRFPVAESGTEIGVPAVPPTDVIAGRESWVIAGRDSCTVYVKHIEFEPGVGTFEFAELAVTFPDAGMPGVGDPCVPARTLAASAWEHLPAVR